MRNQTAQRFMWKSFQPYQKQHLISKQIEKWQRANGELTTGEEEMTMTITLQIHLGNHDWSRVRPPARTHAHTNEMISRLGSQSAHPPNLRFSIKAPIDMISYHDRWPFLYNYAKLQMLAWSMSMKRVFKTLYPNTLRVLKVKRVFNTLYALSKANAISKPFIKTLYQNTLRVFRQGFKTRYEDKALRQGIETMH